MSASPPLPIRVCMTPPLLLSAVVPAPRDPAERQGFLR